MGAHNKNSLQSKADQTVRISQSVFVSNFPDGCTAKDLWKVCNDYGTVVDVFIPNKKSKVGKRFALVRFIKVINLDRLIENLNTIWIGRFNLFANPVRFERPKKPNLSPNNNAAVASSYPRGLDQAKGQFQTGSYVNVVNGSSPVGVHGPSISSASVLVLDDSCVAERDLSNHVMGNVKDVSSISNLRIFIMEKGFSVVNLVYLGGLWVMIECDNVETKVNMLQHTGVKSWFHVLKNVVHDLVNDERIVWVDIEGIPLNVWSRKVYMIRANELFTLSPIFLGQKGMEYTSDEDSDVGPQKVPDRSQFCEEGPNDDRQQSEDPFNIYRLLRKQPGDESHEVSSSLSHPSGFTSDVLVIRNENAKEIPVVVNAKVMNNSQDVYKEASCDNVDPNVVKKGWSVLGFMEDMIRVFRKRLLWDYVSTLIDRWNGEVVVLGDF
nr:RNA-directed DNA polymerase, eukaryota, nucleotide-binding alpha-beta plait domain protein [Tanacetum cinerariifolium]